MVGRKDDIWNIVAEQTIVQFSPELYLDYDSWVASVM